MARQFGRELLHLDFMTIHTLKALLQPGLLTREFLDGRRRRYLSPIKLYFLCAGIFFFAAPLVGFSLFDMLRGDEQGALKGLVQTRMTERAMSAELFAERFDLRIQTVYTLALSISIAVTGLMLRLLFRRWTLGAHLVFALHYVSFLYLAALVLSAIQKVTGAHSPLASLALTYMMLMPYLYLAFRRVYEEGPPRVALKVLALCAVTFVVDNAVSFGALMLTLRLV